MGLQQFERRLERLVEGVFAKAFRSGLQPIEIGRRLTREMDLGRTVGVRGVIAPNHFVVTLDNDDRERFAGYEETLIRELADAAREHARDEGYSFVGPVEIAFESAAIGTGTFRLDATVVEGPGPVASVVTGEGERVPVGDEPVTIGRLPDCDVVLADKNASRRHAEVRREGQEFVVVDLDSTNGTRVNGAGIKQRQLRDGDRITIGSTELRFETS